VLGVQGTPVAELSSPRYVDCLSSSSDAIAHERLTLFLYISI